MGTTSTSGGGGVDCTTTVVLADAGLAVGDDEAMSDCVVAICGELGVDAAGDGDGCCVRNAPSWLSIVVTAWEETPAFFSAAMSAAERL